MPIDQTQQQTLLSWMRSKGVGANCHACGHSNWATGDVVSAAVMSPGGNVAIGGPSVPMVQVICGHCAHVVLFAAVPIGLV